VANNNPNQQANQASANAAQQQANALNQSRQALTELLQLQRDYASEARDAARGVFDNNIQVQETAKAFRDIASASRQFEQNIGDVLSGTKTLASLEKDIANSEKAKNRLLVEARQALNKMNFSQSEITEALRDQNGLYRLIGNTTNNLTDAQTDLLFLYAEQQSALEEQSREMQILAERAGNIDDAFGLAGGSAEGLTGILGKLGGSKFSKMLGIDEAVQGSREFAAELTGGGARAATLGDKFKVAGNLAKNLGGNLMKSLGPIALIAIAVEQLIDAFKMVDKASGDTAKNLGVSYDAAQQMTSEMNNVAMASDDIMVNTKNLVAAQNTLNGMFGTTVQFSGQMAEDFVSLQTRLGLSEEAMKGFTQLTMNNGKGLKENFNQVSNTVLKLNEQNKIGLSAKTIQEGVGKAGAAFRLTMKGSAEEITKGVFNAKKLGLELADLEKTQSSLLDFESSIGNELEAELLTGKELNLEKARAIALTGKTGELAAEVSKQIGTSAEFGEMNFLAQDALAKSFGMSREELAGMLESQETLVKLQKAGYKDMNVAQEEYNRMVAAGASQAELDAKFKDEALNSQLKSVSQQERMEAIVTRLKEVFVGLVEPLMPVVGLLGDLFEGIVKPLMATIGPLIKDLSTGLMAVLKPVMQILGPMMQGWMEGLTSVFAPIKELFGSIDELMTEIFGKGQGLGDVFKVIGTVLGTLYKVTFVPIKAAITYMVQGLKSAIGIVSGFVDIFQGNFGEGLKKIAQGVIGFILRPFQLIIDLATGTLNAVIDGLNKIPGVDLPKVEFNLADSVTGLLPMAKGGIVTGPTKALVGEAGPEAVIPLREFYAKMDELIQAVKQGQNIYIGPNKLNESIGLNLHSVG
jgi:hypothetical protein